jgi:hypothetical protein
MFDSKRRQRYEFLYKCKDHQDTKTTLELVSKVWCSAKLKKQEDCDGLFSLVEANSHKSSDMV